jgi:hypothetical protein
MKNKKLIIKIIKLLITFINAIIFIFLIVFLVKVFTFVSYGENSPMLLSNEEILEKIQENYDNLNAKLNGNAEIYINVIGAILLLNSIVFIAFGVNEAIKNNIIYQSKKKNKKLN